MVRQVAAHKDVSVWVGGGAGEAAEMADGVSRSVQQEEGSVAEEVVGFERANLADVRSAEIYLT